MTKIPQLKQEYTKIGQVFTLVKRTENVAMYQSEWGHYEVFIIKTAEPKTIFGREYPRMEVYACNDDFGYRAYCCKTLEKAEIRYKELNERMN